MLRRAWSRAGSWRALGAVLVAVGTVGCGGSAGVETLVCTPPCPAGTTCTADGCRAMAALDLGVAPQPDLLDRCGGQCRSPTPRCGPSGQCVACLADTDCPAGNTCRMVGALSTCLPGCSASAPCPGGDGGAALLCCGGACIDPRSDGANCGACGSPCALAHASARCLGATCVLDACDPRWGDCNHDPQDGCETNLHVDITNCGACGTRCAIQHARAACADGACYVGHCDFGWDDCNGNAADGCEVSVLSDLKNCGVCGNACTNPPHARSKCENAACQLAACDQGFADCDGDPTNGCEVAVGIDVKNCGACGNQCSQGLICKSGGCTCPQCNIPNAKSKCVNQQCVLDACLPGFADCNNDPKDGCEVAVLYDKKNCGGCNMVCPMGQVCLQGKCSVCNGNILVIGDDQNQANLDLIDDINAAGLHGELVNNGSTNYIGVPDANDYGAVVILIGNNYAVDLPLAGQNSIAAAQANQTGVVLSEWFAYEISTAHYQKLAPLQLLKRDAGTPQVLTFTSEAQHPLWDGLPNSWKTKYLMGANTGSTLLNNGVRIAKCDECLSAGVVVRDDGAGRVVQMAFAADYTSGQANNSVLAWKNDANLSTLMVNAIRWAARCM